MGESIDRLEDRLRLAAAKADGGDLVALAKSKKVWVPPHVRIDPVAKKVVHVEGYWRTVMAGSSGHLPSDVVKQADTFADKHAVTVAQADGAIKGAQWMLQKHMPKANDVEASAAWKALSHDDRLKEIGQPEVITELKDTIALLTAAKMNPGGEWPKGETVRIGRNRGRLEDALEIATIARGVRTGEMSAVEGKMRLDALEERYGPDKIKKTQTKDMPVEWGLVWDDARVAVEDLRIAENETIADGESWKQNTKAGRLQWAHDNGLEAAPALPDELLDEWHDIVAGHEYAAVKWEWPPGVTPAIRLDAIETYAASQAQTDSALAAVEADIASAPDVTKGPPKGMPVHVAYFSEITGKASHVFKWNAKQEMYEGFYVSAMGPHIAWTPDDMQNSLTVHAHLYHEITAEEFDSTPNPIPPNGLAKAYADASGTAVVWNPTTGEFDYTDPDTDLSLSPAMLKSMVSKGDIHEYDPDAPVTVIEADASDGVPIPQPSAEFGSSTPTFTTEHGTKVPPEGFGEHGGPAADMAMQYIWSAKDGSGQFEVYTFVGDKDGSDGEYVEESSGQKVTWNTLEHMLGLTPEKMTENTAAGPGDVTTPTEDGSPPGGLKGAYVATLPKSGIKILNVWSEEYKEYAQFEKAPGASEWTLSQTTASPSQMKKILLGTPGWYSATDKGDLPSEVWDALAGEDDAPPTGMAEAYLSKFTSGAAKKKTLWSWDPADQMYKTNSGGTATATDMQAWVDSDVVEESAPSEVMEAPGGLNYLKGADAPPMGLPATLVSTKTGATLEYEPMHKVWVEAGDGGTFDVADVQMLMEQGTLASAEPPKFGAGQEPVFVPTGAPPNGMAPLYADTSETMAWVAWAPALGKYVNDLGEDAPPDAVAGDEYLTPGTPPPDGMAPQYVLGGGDSVEGKTYTWDPGEAKYVGSDGSVWSAADFKPLTDPTEDTGLLVALPTMVVLNMTGSPFPFTYNKETGFFESPGKMSPSPDEIADMLQTGKAVSAFGPPATGAPEASQIPTPYIDASGLPEGMEPLLYNPHYTAAEHPAWVLQWNPDAGLYKSIYSNTQFEPGEIASSTVLQPFPLVVVGPEGKAYAWLADEMAYQALDGTFADAATVIDGLTAEDGGWVEHPTPPPPASPPPHGLGTAYTVTNKVFTWNPDTGKFEGVEEGSFLTPTAVLGLIKSGNAQPADAPSSPAETPLPETPTVATGIDDPAILEALAAITLPDGSPADASTPEAKPVVQPWQAGVYHTDYVIEWPEDSLNTTWYLTYDAEQNALLRREGSPDAPVTGSYSIEPGQTHSIDMLLGHHYAKATPTGDVINHNPQVPYTKDTKVINPWLKARGANYTGKMKAADKQRWADLYLAGHHTGHFELERRAALKGTKPITHKNQTKDPNSPYTPKGMKTLAAFKQVLQSHPVGQRVLATPDPRLTSMSPEERLDLLKALGMHHNLRTTSGSWLGTYTDEQLVGTFEGRNALKFRMDNILTYTNFNQMPSSPVADHLAQDEQLATVDLPGDHGKGYIVGSASAFASTDSDMVVIINDDGSVISYLSSGEVKVAEGGSGTANVLSEAVSTNPDKWQAVTAKDSPARPNGIPDEVWNFALASEGSESGLLDEVWPAMASFNQGASKWTAMSTVLGPMFGGAYLTDLPEGQRRVALWAAIDVNPAIASSLGLKDDLLDGMPDAPDSLMPALQALAPRHLTTPPQLRRRGRFLVQDGSRVQTELRPGDTVLRRKDGNLEWLVVRGSAWPVPGERIAIHADGTVTDTPVGSISEYAPAEPSEVVGVPQPKTLGQVKKAYPGFDVKTWNTLQTVEALDEDEIIKTLLPHAPTYGGVDAYLTKVASGSAVEPSEAFMAHASSGAKALFVRGTPQVRDALNWMADNGHWGSGPPSLPTSINWSKPWVANAAKGLLDVEQVKGWTIKDRKEAYTDLKAAGLIPKTSSDAPADAVAKALPELLAAIAPGTGQPNMPGVESEPAKPKGPVPGVELSLTLDPKVKLGGMHSKKAWIDQFDRHWMTKGFPSDPNSKARVDAEHWAMEMGRLHGFRNPESRVMTVEGNYSYAQHLAPKTGDMTGVSKPWEQLDETSLIDALREHVNDWAVSNHDTHQENLLRHPDGFVYGIDKGQAFKFFGQDQEILYSMQGGAVRGWHPPGNGAPVWYDRAYAAVAAKQVDKEQLRRVTKAVLTRAKAVSTQKDTQHREMLEEAFKNRTNFPNGLTREQFIDLAMERKQSTFDDFVGMWQAVWESGGYTWDLDTANLGVGVIHHPETGQAVYSGISPEYIADVENSKSLGVPTFFAGTDLEDSHMLLWEEKEPDGDRMLMGEGKLRAEADAAVTAFLKAEGYDTGDAKATPNAPDPGEPLPGNSSWHATIVAAAKTVNVHASDGDYNTTTLSNLAATKKQLVSIQNGLILHHQEGKVYSGFVDTPAGPTKVASLHQQQGYLDMAKTYLTIIDQIEDAKAKGGKTPSKAYGPFVYTPEKPKVVVEEWTHPTLGTLVKHDDGSWEQTAPNGTVIEVPNEPTAPENSGWSKVTMNEVAGKELKIVKNKAFRAQGQFDVSTAELKQTGGKVTDGNSGNRYDISYGDVEIEYRPWKGEGVPKAQQGTLRFSIKNWTGNEGQLQDLFEVMAKMGVNLDPADETDLELFYWRHLNGVLNNRKLNTSHEQGRKQIADWYSANPDPTPEEEIAALRAGFETVFGKKAVAEADVLPKVQEAGFGRQGGKPYWTRPDARTVKEWFAKKGDSAWLKHNLKSESHVPLMVGSGGMLSTEERLRALGQMIHGSSSTSDQGHGSSGFLYFKPGAQSPGSSTIMFSPLLYNRTTNYSYSGDNFGEIDNRKNAALSLDGVSKSGQYEMLTKNFVSLIQFMEVITVGSESKRKEILSVFKAAGITEIRGIPVDERIVTSSYDAQKVLAKAKQGYIDNDQWGEAK